jgi:hypothetical protein
VFDLASEMLFFSFGFQPMHAGGLSGRDQASSPADAFDFEIASPPRSSC